MSIDTAIAVGALVVAAVALWASVHKDKQAEIMPREVTEKWFAVIDKRLDRIENWINSSRNDKGNQLDRSK